MRVPIPLVLVLCIAVVAGTWWAGSRNTDFITPPSDSELAAIRLRIESSIPPSDQPEDAVSAPSDPANPPPSSASQTAVSKPAFDQGDMTRPPKLDEYNGFGSQGAQYLMDLAALLESEGRFQRALLAWERVIDTAKPDDAQFSTAISAIQRLRPTLPDWNTDPALAIPVTLHAGTGKNAALILTPILEETARELETASAGILKVTANVAAGKSDLNTNGPTPAALWFAGPSENARSTEVLSFTFESPETLREEVRKTTFRILRAYIARTVSLTPPRSIADDAAPLPALQTHISRWTWQEFGSVLNLPPDPDQ